MIIAGVIIFIIIIYLLAKYNGLVKLRNKVKQAESGIEVYLKQRFDLIPNLVECVKAYTKYESEVFENIIKLRTEYNNSKDVDLKQAEELNNGINKIMAVAEGYPELKASEQYLNLQKNLTKIESQLQAARRIYNTEVTTYNTKLETIPTNIVAGIFGFKKADLFQIEEAQKENIDVKKLMEE